MKDGDRSSVDSLISCLVCHNIVCEPHTLPCLHSCCKGCVGAIAGVAVDGDECSDRGSRLVTCPVCGIAASSTSLIPNALIAAYAEGSRSTTKEAPSCDICLNEHHVTSIGEYKCEQCDHHLCGSCLRWHNKFNRRHTVVPLAAAAELPESRDKGQADKGSHRGSSSLPPVLAIVAASCSAHGHPCSSYCFTCHRLTCDACLDGGASTRCVLDSHDVAALASERTGDYVERIRRNVDATLDHVARDLATARTLYGGGSEDDDSGLEAAREADLRRLLGHKRAALDRVGRAYKRAEQLLCDAYVDLACKAPERLSTTDRLLGQLRHVRCYAELLLDGIQRPPASEGGSSSSSGHRAVALDQHAAVVSCVRTLLHNSSEMVLPAAGMVSTELDEAIAGGGGSGSEDAERDAEVELLVCRWLPDVAALIAPAAADDDEGQPAESPLGLQPQAEVDLLADRERGPPTAAAALPGRSTSWQHDQAAAENSAAFISQPRATVAAGSEQAAAAAAAMAAESLAPGPEATGDSQPTLLIPTAGSVAAEPDDRAAPDPSRQRAAADAELSLLHCCSCAQPATDPVLLACLHSCCQRCLDKIASPHDLRDPQSNGGDPGSARRQHVTCPLCCVASDAAGLKRNDFVAMLASAERAATGPSLCDPCNENYYDVEAQHACRNCGKIICDKCLAWHNKFSPDHVIVSAAALVAERRRDVAERLMLPMCEEHGDAKCDMFCVECGSPRCITCGKPCMELKHDIVVANGRRAVELVSDLSNRVRANLAVVGAHAKATLMGVDGDPERRLHAAREADAGRLRQSSRSLLDAVGVVLGKVEEEVATTYAKWAHDVTALRTSGSRTLDVRVCTAERYCNALLESASSISILGQREPIIRCLDSLRAELDALPVLSGFDEAVVTDGSQQYDVLEEVVRAWVGCSRFGRTGKTLEGMHGTLAGPQDDQTVVGKDTLRQGTRAASVTTSSAMPNQIDETLGDDVILNDIAIDDIGGAASLQLRPPSFGKPSCTFNAGDDCRDLAFTADGRILLAALKKGMKEYDCSKAATATSSESPRQPAELSRWRPPPTEDGGEDCVSTVHAFEDGLVVVGLINSQSVALLRRNAPGAKEPWLEEQRFMLRTGPWRLAGHGDLLAVSGARDVVTKKSRHWSPGPYLDLMRVGDGQPLLTLNLKYDVQGLVLTGRAIVVLSNDAQQLAPNGTRCYVVDAYSHAGEHLWRNDSGNACDACSAWPREGLGILYLAQLHSDRVRAISHVDGQYLEDAVSSYHHGLRSPIGLSLLAAADSSRPAALAVLSAGNEVNVYPARDGA